jgi:hypothetical protein
MSWEPCPGHGCPRPSDWFVRGRRLSHSVGHRCPGNHALDMDVHGHRNQPVDDLRDEKRVPEHRKSTERWRPSVWFVRGRRPSHSVAGLKNPGPLPLGGEGALQTLHSQPSTASAILLSLCLRRTSGIILL